MANYGSPSVKITFSTSSGTTVTHNLANYIDSFNGVKISGMTQESHAFGDSWVENLFTGVKQLDDLTFSGFYEDVAASGPHALFGNTSDVGAERLVEFDFGSSDIVNIRYIQLSYSRMPTRGELTRWEMVGKPTGAPTTAT